MIARFSTALATGTIVTFALLYVMQLLIDLQPGAGSASPPPWAFKWGTRVIDTPPPPPPPEIDKEKLLAAPLTPARQQYGEPGIGVHLPKEGPTQVELVEPGPDLGVRDGPLVEIMRVQPDYPIGARRRELEGWVIVEFDVLASGSVTNVVVIESSDRVFDNAAIRAAQRFRFKARVVDGVPRQTTGIRKLFRFDMSD